jgi:hypothetical protein
VRTALALLLCWPLAVFAVDRDLDDCTVGSTPTALAPLDLDNCTINDGDDISGILTGLDTTYGNVYVRAPSRTLAVTSDTIAFTVDNFYFYEDESAGNKLTVTHDPSNPSGTISRLYSCTRCDTVLDYCPLGAAPLGGSGDLPQRTTIMWALDNFDNVLIGGASLSITLTGTHPGLGRVSTLTCGDKPAYPTNEINVGLVDLRVTDTSNPPLVDVRANFRNAEAYGLYLSGTQAVGYATGRADQVNIAGVFLNTSGAFVNGARNIWFDPDRTVFSDPYNRGFGWDGEVALTTGGRDVGCFDRKRSANGRMTNSAPYFADSVTGGVTFEWGYLGWQPREVNVVGSAAAPFIIRVKDWGTSGPNTGYPAGVKVKKSYPAQSIFFKGDPHPNYDSVATPFRFVRFIALPDEYGSGLYGAAIDQSLCAAGNSGVVSNNQVDALDNTIRLEANDVASYENVGWQIEFSGDWTTTWARGDLFLFQNYPDYSSDRSWDHTLVANDGMTFSDTIRMIDTHTLTGPGTFSNVAVGLGGAVPSNAVARDNTVTDTNVSGAIAIGASSGTTTIANVNFTGAARAVITIATGSTAIVTDLCVPDGSTITGAGTLTYEGAGQSLPYTIPNSTANCAITANPRPGPVTGGGVN